MNNIFLSILAGLVGIILKLVDDIIDISIPINQTAFNILKIIMCILTILYCINDYCMFLFIILCVYVNNNFFEKESVNSFWKLYFIILVFFSVIYFPFQKVYNFISNIGTIQLDYNMILQNLVFIFGTLASVFYESDVYVEEVSKRKVFDRLFLCILTAIMIYVINMFNMDECMFFYLSNFAIFVLFYFLTSIINQVILLYVLDDSHILKKNYKTINKNIKNEIKKNNKGNKLINKIIKKNEKNIKTKKTDKTDNLSENKV